MTEVVVGTGGKQLYPLVKTTPGTKASVQGMEGVLSLTLRQRGWDWKFVTTSGAVRDSGSAACQV